MIPAVLQIILGGTCIIVAIASNDDPMTDLAGRDSPKARRNQWVLVVGILTLVSGLFHTSSLCTP